jgi:XTP/dITP diphosphohydrolase
VTELVVATANPEKAREVVEILAPLLPGFVLVTRPPEIPDVPETGSTLQENALLKSRALARATGRAAIADDTGLEVDALDGAPGVYSARFAGPEATDEENVDKLLLALSGRTDRAARFRTVIAVTFPGGEEIVEGGEVTGTIATRRHGPSRFGYDPVFIPDGSLRTFAELSAAEKHAISHRGRALRAIAPLIAATGR